MKNSATSLHYTIFQTLTMADECVGDIPDLDENQSAMVNPGRLC